MYLKGQSLKGKGQSVLCISDGEPMVYVPQPAVCYHLNLKCSPSLCSGISPRLGKNRRPCEIMFSDPVITFTLGRRIILK